MNPFYRTQEEVNFLFNQVKASLPRCWQMSSQAARAEAGAGRGAHELFLEMMQDWKGINQYESKRASP